MCALCMVVQDCLVTRIDEGLGLVLELPTEPAVSAGFVHISNAGDSKIDKLQQVRCYSCSSAAFTLGWSQVHIC